MCRLVSTIVSAVLMLATHLPAQNLLVNPDFDTDLAGWSGIGAWSPTDAFGFPTSGSATWVNTWATGGGYYLQQCVDLAPFFEAYDLSGWAYIPSGQAATGIAGIVVTFHSDPGCITFLNNHTIQDLSNVGNWELLSRTDWVPTGAMSALVRLKNQKSGPEDFETFHDCVFFGPNPTMIFADDFESVDTSQWSASHGGR